MQYENLVKIVQSVIDSFTQVAVAHLSGLKKFLQTTTLKVQVQNPAKKVEVMGEVKVSNMPPLLKAIGGIPLAINALKKAVIANKTVMVSNLKDLKFPEFPKKIEISNPQKEVKITNMKEFTDAVEKIAEFLAKVKYDPRIEVKPTPINIKAPVVNVPAPVVNVPKQEPPVVNVEKPDLSDIKKLLKFFEDTNAKNPLAVQLSDGKKYYKALEKMAEIYAGSSFSAFQDESGADARALVNSRHELVTVSSDAWGTNDSDQVDETNSYVGEENLDGSWRIKKVSVSGNVTSTRYATKKNNPSVESYADAWTDRASLTYGYAKEAL